MIDINKQEIFDLWEHDFDINRSAHICDNLDFHYVYKGKCIRFLLKIKNCSMTVRKGNHLARIKYLNCFYYKRMEKVTYKNNEKYAMIARVIFGQILLPKKDHCYISEYE